MLKDLDVWTTQHHGLMVLIDLFGVLFGFIALLVVMYGALKWWFSFQRPELSKSLAERLNSVKDRRQRKRVFKLTERIIDARRLHEDVSWLIHAWARVLCFYIFCVVFLGMATFLVVVVTHDGHHKTIPFGVSVVILFVFTLVLYAAFIAVMGLERIDRGFDYHATLRKTWVEIKEIVDANFSEQEADEMLTSIKEFLKAPLVVSKDASSFDFDTLVVSKTFITYPQCLHLGVSFGVSWFCNSVQFSDTRCHVKACKINHLLNKRFGISGQKAHYKTAGPGSFLWPGVPVNSSVIFAPSIRGHSLIRVARKISLTQRKLWRPLNASENPGCPILHARRPREGWETANADSENKL